MRTGAIAPSSKNLAEVITDTANLFNKKSVVELGPGTGVFTKVIRNKMSPNAVFFCLESNLEFVKETRKKSPNTIVYHALAQDINKYLLKHDLKKSDCIISNLPWAFFDKNSQTNMLDIIYNSIEKGGEFLTFAYLHGFFLPNGINFRKLLNDKFSFVKKTKIIWKNLPPAIVYYCKK